MTEKTMITNFFVCKSNMKQYCSFTTLNFACILIYAKYNNILRDLVSCICRKNSLTYFNKNANFTHLYVCMECNIICTHYLHSTISYKRSRRKILNHIFLWYLANKKLLSKTQRIKGNSNVVPN